MSNLVPINQDKSFDKLFEYHIDQCVRLLKALAYTKLFPGKICFVHKDDLADGVTETWVIPDAYKVKGQTVKVLKLKGGSVTAPTFVGFPNEYTLQACSREIKYKVTPYHYCRFPSYDGSVFADEWTAAGIPCYFPPHDY